MKSMTGFARGEAETGAFTLALEVKGYNSRFLDITAQPPPRYASLEPFIRERVFAVCKRGKVELSVKVKEKQKKCSVSIHEEVARAYLKAADTLRPGEALPLSTLFSLEGVLDIESPPADAEALEAALAPLLDGVLRRFDAERRREGEAACKEIRRYAAILRAEAANIAARAGEVEDLIKNNIRARFAELAGNSVDEQRVLAETAALLLKWTIAEELCRLTGHLDAFDAETEKEAPAKTLEFLCQEINREVTTISAKAPQLEVSRAVVRCKEALENIREQLRNVE